MKRLFLLFSFTLLITSNVFAQENTLNSLIEEIHEKDQFARKKLIEFTQKGIADSILYYSNLMAKSDKENSETIFRILDTEG